MKKLLNIILAYLILVPTVNAQERTVFNTERALILENESKEQQITIDVSETYDALSLNIGANLHEGKLTIEIFDPSGEKQGNFSIGTQLEGVSNPGTRERVQGKINKVFENPRKGKWLVKISPLNAKAQINIQVRQIEQ
ncbi:MAG: hypothetical protein V2I46_04305 [Bacteroides sp.]|jgi:hypothetical protein|nr:hypothetical protein [Bacteroides sp.]